MDVPAVLADPGSTGERQALEDHPGLAADIQHARAVAAMTV